MKTSGQFSFSKLENEFLEDSIKQLNQDYIVILEHLSKAVIRFIEEHPPKTMKRNLFSLFVDYIYTLKGGTPNDLDNILFDFKELFILLDKIEDEIEK